MSGNDEGRRNADDAEGRRVRFAMIDDEEGKSDDDEGNVCVGEVIRVRVRRRLPFSSWVSQIRSSWSAGVVHWVNDNAAAVALLVAVATMSPDMLVSELSSDQRLIFLHQWLEEHPRELAYGLDHVGFDDCAGEDELDGNLHMGRNCTIVQGMMRDGLPDDITSFVLRLEIHNRCQEGLHF